MEEIQSTIESLQEILDLLKEGEITEEMASQLVTLF